MNLSQCMHASITTLALLAPIITEGKISDSPMMSLSPRSIDTGTQKEQCEDRVKILVALLIEPLRTKYMTS